MKNEEWIIVDTETDGLWEPIHVVEIAAQRMKGWQPLGKPFQVYLNHNVRMPPAATAVHGYTREFLAEHGIPPRQAHSMFGDYIEDLPVAAHNLSFDWNRALIPEWRRLRIPPSGTRGFCTMTLCRRVIHEVPNHKLETLKRYFQIRSGRSHQALADVETVVKLFTSFIGPRLEPLGLTSLKELARFSKKSPIAECIDLIRSHNRKSPPSRSWYCLDAEGIKKGPFTEQQARKAAENKPCYIWQET